MLHRVGGGDDIVVQLAIGDALFWVSRADSTMRRYNPLDLGGATGRILLVVETPETVMAAAVEAGARETSAVRDEHGWRLGRIVDPFGHEWEVGRPLGAWASL